MSLKQEVIGEGVGAPLELSLTEAMLMGSESQSVEEVKKAGLTKEEAEAQGLRMRLAFLNRILGATPETILGVMGLMPENRDVVGLRGMEEEAAA